MLFQSNMGKGKKRQQRREREESAFNADRREVGAQQSTSDQPRRSQRSTKGIPPERFGEWAEERKSTVKEKKVPVSIAAEEFLSDGCDDDDDKFSEMSSKSKFSHKSKGQMSKISNVSSYNRRIKEVELEAELERNKLLDLEDALEKKKIERQKDLIEKRLALEKTKIAEDDVSDKLFLYGDAGKSEKSIVKSEVKVASWLNEQKGDRRPDKDKSQPNDSACPVSKNTIAAEVSTSTDVIGKFLIRQTIGRDLPIYDGSPEEWPSFIEEYKRTTEACQFTDGENLIRLRKCLKGKAKEAVQSMMIAPKNVDSIIETLILNFGHHNRIIKSLIAKARNAATPDNEYPQTIIDFANAVRNLVTTIDSLGKTEHLRNPQLQDELIAKLPTSYRQHWVRFAYNISNVDLEVFSIWLNREAAMANSLLDLELPTPSKKLETKKQAEKMDNRNRQKQTVFATNTGNSEKPQQQSSKCEFCEKKGHLIGHCRSFAKENLDSKWKFVGEKRLCFCCLVFGHRIGECEKKLTCGEDGCQRSHHPVLHSREGVKSQVVKPREKTKSVPTLKESFEVETEAEVKLVGHTVHVNEVLLRVVPVTLKGPKGTLRTFALLDDCSTLTMMDEAVAKSIGLEGPKSVLETQWTNEMTAKEHDSMLVNLEIQGKDCKTSYKLTNVRTVKNLKLPSQSVNMSKLSGKWKHLNCVDVSSISNAIPTILIGEDHPHIKLARDVVEGPTNAPVATRTLLGWIVHGRCGKFKDRVNCNFTLHIYQKNKEDRMDELIKQHFYIEDLGVKIIDGCLLSKEEKRVKIITEATTRRIGKRWETGILWKTDNVSFPESRNVAMRRLFLLERKLDQNPHLANVYCKKIEEYIAKGYARKLSPEDAFSSDKNIWYLPHFGVTNPNKPGKMRLVFDGASKANGVSLNDFMMKGMDLLNSLPSVLCNFRRGKIAFCGDISEMYHQVQIRKEDVAAQRFLWRGMDRGRPPDVMEMSVMVFGLASSPYSAQYVKNINAKEFEDKYPNAVKTIVDYHYMDDCLDSEDSVEDAVRKIKDINFIHGQGGFHMCNWISNSKEVLQKLPPDLTAVESKEMKLNEEMPTERVLGMFWNPNEDAFSFVLRVGKLDPILISAQVIPTKRQVLRIVMAIFDPLGFLIHLNTKAKILMQDIWRSKVAWDEKIKGKEYARWKSWLAQLDEIGNFKIPRCFSLKLPKSTSITLHIFCDSSEKAYAAVAYIRVESEDGCDVSFVMAKSKVAPLLIVSIPRLELQAALLGSRLGSTLINSLGVQIDVVYFWTDSKTVLCWLRSEARRFKQFVSHRVGEIEELTDIKNWRWVPTKENVADEATRDNKLSNLESSSRWLNGPPFLKLSFDQWPSENQNIFEVNEEDLEIKQIICSVTENKLVTEILPDVDEFTTWVELIQSTSRNILKSRLNTEEDPAPELTVEIMKEAELMWIKYSQSESFGEELEHLRNGVALSRKSRLYQLSPILLDNVIVVKSRLTESPELTDDAKRPVILDPKHQYTKLLVNHFHVKAGHNGQERVVNDLRQKYWILDLRTAVKSSWNSCQECKERRAKPSVPEMAPLPKIRLTRQFRPFAITGVDYFGPMEVTIGRRREKRYGALFTCMSTRAIHLEIAHSLTTDSAIMALQRFTYRRGYPMEIYSDNGSNFRGADVEIKNALADWDKEKIRSTLAVDGVTWHFIPPYAPHMGGCWERLVGSVKKALKATLNDLAPREEVLTTFLTAAEFAINSRPLTHVSVDPDDPESLTPNHFLLGNSGGQQVYGKFDKDDFCLRKQWKIAQAMADHFWKRWIREYLPTLAKRPKWRSDAEPVKIGDKVFIADPEQQRNFGPKGVVTATYPGKDGNVRTVDVQTESGTYRRPVVRVCVIGHEKESDKVEMSAGHSTGGSMLRSK